jgi:hypothetical protein
MAKYAAAKKSTYKKAKKFIYKKPAVIASYSEAELASGFGEGRGKNPIAPEPIIGIQSIALALSSPI